MQAHKQLSIERPSGGEGHRKGKLKEVFEEDTQPATKECASSGPHSSW